MALKDQMERGNVKTALYLEFTYVQPFHGTSRTVYWGEMAFNVPAVSGNPRVYPVIRSFGPLRNFAPLDGEPRRNFVDIEVDLLAKYVTHSDTARITVREFLNYYRMPTNAVKVWQWNFNDTTQSLVWQGYFTGDIRIREAPGESTAILQLSEIGRTASEVFFAGDAISVEPAVGWTTTPDAPTDSIGKMIGEGFGKQFVGLASSDTAPNDAVFLGYGTTGIPGVIVDENEDNLQARIQFLANGTADVALLGTTNAPETASSFWVYIPEASTFGMIDAADLADVSGGGGLNDLTIRCKLEPTLFLALRPAGVGAQVHSGLTSSLYTVLDDKPENYSESDTTNSRWAFNIPAISIQGLRVLEVGCVIDIANASGATRDVQFGLWNDYNSAGATWWGNSAAPKRTQLTSLSATRARYYTAISNRYVRTDNAASYNLGSRTHSEFSEGRFIGRDSSDNDTPIQLVVDVYSSGKSGVRLYGVGVYVKAFVQLDRVKRVIRSVEVKKKFTIGGGYYGNDYEVVTAQEEEVGVNTGERRMEFLFCGVGIEDDGTYGGSSGDPIHKASAQVHHLLDKGDPINTTAGTLGNFVDARSEVVAGEKKLSPYFGPAKPINVREAAEEVQRRHPCRFIWDNQKWNAIYEEMNPHSSRWYRSTSDVRRISAKRDIVGPITITALPVSQIRNSVVLSYGHVYGTNRPVRSTAYVNPLSTEYFGEHALAPAPSEPWICPDAIDTVPPAATYLAQFLGRKKARPRLRVNVPLSLAFYDIRKGHVVEFDQDMEDASYFCPAFRCGLMDFALPSSSSTTNAADDTTPQLLLGSGNREAYFCASQQPLDIITTLSVAGAYTASANPWQWYDPDAGSWTNFTGLGCDDGGSASTVWTRTGTIRTFWDRVSPWLWKKGELSLGITIGPGYIFRHNAINVTLACNGAAQTTCSAKWLGRLFEVIEVTRKPGGASEYETVEVVLEEVM